MLTENFIKCVRNAFNTSNSTLDSVVIQNGNEYKISNGGSNTNNAMFSNNATFIETAKSIETTIMDTKLSQTGFLVSYGTGNTKPTMNDYNLEHSIDDLELLSGKVVRNSYNENSDTLYTFTTVIKNPTADNIVINELGVFGIWYIDSKYNGVLLMREVLENPVTIASGEYHSFVIDICDNLN